MHKIRLLSAFASFEEPRSPKALQYHAAAPNGSLFFTVYRFKIQEFVTNSTREVIEHNIIFRYNILMGGENNQSSNLCPVFFGQSARGIH